MKRLTCLIVLVSSTTWAADAGSARSMSIGAGIASPSRTSALLENPAGLSLNEKTRVMGLVRSENDSFDPLGYGGGIFFGNGQVGVGADVERIADSTNILNVGFGFQLSSTDFSFGADLHHPLDNGGGWTVDLGAIFNAKGKWRIGAEVFNAFDGLDGFGAGLATNLSNEVTFAIDATTSDELKGFALKPGIGIDLKNFQITYGYGFRVDNNYPSIRIFEKHALGIGIRLTNSVHLQGYYNQLAKYFIAAVFQL